MLTIYGMTLSGPALKVFYTANYLGLDYETKALNLKEGEGQTPEYKAIHPQGKVPAMVDGDFTLWESSAIMRYLANKENSDLYPTELKQRAQVDQWLDFAAIHIQNGVGKLLWNKVFAPMMKVPVDETSLADGKKWLERDLPILDEQYKKNTYITGDQFTLADIAVVACTDPLEVVGVDVSAYPNLAKYREEQRAQDYYQKVHKVYGEALMSKS